MKIFFVYIISEECHNTVYTPKYTHLLYKICNYEYRIMNTILHVKNKELLPIGCGMKYKKNMF